MPWFIASIDKLFTATLLLQLTEQGAVDLDKSMREYLPEVLCDGLHVLDGTDYTDQVTVRHLITHTSGIADWYEDFPKEGKNLVEEIVRSGDRSLTLEEMMDYVRTRLRPNFAPQPVAAFVSRDGQGLKLKTRYSDTGFMLLCAIIMHVTRQSLEGLHQERIYSPLGMKYTWLAGRTSPTEAVTSPFPMRADKEIVDIPEIIRSVWGVYSTSDDMVTFMRALVSGQLFEKPETRNLMLSGWHRFGFPSDRASIRLPGWPIAYSHGAMQFQLPWLFSPLRPMPQVFGHTGSSGCWLFYCPDLDLYLTGAADDLTAGALPYRFVPALLKHF